MCLWLLYNATSLPGLNSMSTSSPSLSFLHSSTKFSPPLGEWESAGIRLRPLDSGAYVACLLLFCWESKWFSGKSVWLVFRGSWVWMLAGSWNFCVDLFLTLKTEQRQRPKKWPQPCEVHGEINEYERAAASKAKNGHLKKQSYPHVWWGVQNLTHFLELFQHTLCHPSHILLHLGNRPKSMCHAY